MDSKPTFRPEALHDLSQEGEWDAIERKIQWQPNRERIERLLQTEEVRLQLPKIYYSLQDPELQASLPYKAAFADDLIDSYELLAEDDGVVRMRIWPSKEIASPFWVIIDRHGVRGPEGLVEIFVSVTEQSL